MHIEIFFHNLFKSNYCLCYKLVIQIKKNKLKINIPNVSNNK